MTTRALEDSEIKVIFEHISGTNAVRNRAMLIVGIGLALRASELVGLQAGDVYDGKYVLEQSEGSKTTFWGFFKKFKFGGEDNLTLFCG